MTKQAQQSTYQPLTGQDILNLLGNKPPVEEVGLGEMVVDFASDQINATVTGIARIGAAAVEGGRNAQKHFVLERAVQRDRSDTKLAQAAARAAERINANRQLRLA